MATKKTPKAEKAKPAPKRKIGRPSIYTNELADEICVRLCRGESLIRICKEDGMPNEETVYAWVLNRPEFSKKYRDAREMQQERHLEEIKEISDDAQNDWMEANGGSAEAYRLNGEHIQRSRLRVDTRKWIMERMAARKYGAKVDVNHDIAPESPLSKLFEQIQGTPLKPTKGE